MGIAGFAKGPGQQAQVGQLGTLSLEGTTLQSLSTIWLRIKKINMVALWATVELTVTRSYNHTVQERDSGRGMLVMQTIPFRD